MTSTNAVERGPGGSGFVVVDDFGPMGRRPVEELIGKSSLVPVVFGDEAAAERYARARDAHAAIFAEFGPGTVEEYDARELCKRLVRERHAVNNGRRVR